MKKKGGEKKGAGRAKVWRQDKSRRRGCAKLKLLIETRWVANPTR